MGNLWWVLEAGPVDQGGRRHVRAVHRSARRVLVLATEEARLLGHQLLGPEHILLGLLQAEPGIAAEALVAAGVTLESARSKVAEIAGTGDAATSNPARFTPQAKKVLELSLREALQLGDTHIDTEHVLLATLRSNDGIAALT